jgi:hypothetical protein
MESALRTGRSVLMPRWPCKRTAYVPGFYGTHRLITACPNLKSYVIHIWVARFEVLTAVLLKMSFMGGDTTAPGHFEGS